MLGQQVPGQQQDVVAPFMQGREHQLGHIEAVVQVLPEAPPGHGLPQVHIGGRDDLDVHGHGPGAAHAQDFPFLKHAQELGLIGQGHVRQLVKEERPARGFLHQAAPGADTGGHALFDAEHLAFEQGFGDGRTVDGHKGGVAPGRVVVDGLGEYLLARAGRPQDQGIDGPPGDGQGLGHHLPHGRTAADDAADVVLLLQGLHHLPVILVQAQAAFLQLLGELLHLFQQFRPLEFAGLHLDDHHAEGFGQALQLRRGAAFPGQGEQGVRIRGTPPGKVVAQTDQQGEGSGVLFVHGLSLAQGLHPAQHFRHGADEVLGDVGVFRALFVQAACQRYVAHDGDAFFPGGLDHALGQQALALGQDDGQGVLSFS